MSNDIRSNQDNSVNQSGPVSNQAADSAGSQASSGEQSGILDQTLPEYDSVAILDKYAPNKDFKEPHITRAQRELLEEFGITGLKMEHHPQADVYTLTQDEWDRLHEIMTPIMQQMKKKAQLMVIHARKTLKGHEVAMDCADMIRRNENI
ncbi:MAG: hypothetical protein B0D91_10780 [Oceanospirillales bacterium LUC14_002_19_P2]|nr:MAG: hypothetical protein B0D91_10780 [Oceanospirillales bacterium LUC14_002_19_P2]